MPSTETPQPDRSPGTPQAPWLEPDPPLGGDQAAGVREDFEPRFGTIHLIVWSVVTAFYVGVQAVMSVEDWMTGLDPGHRLLYSAHRALGWPSRGATLAGLLLLLYRRHSGLPFLRHPGEWLWAAMGGSLLIWVAARLGAFIARPGAEPRPLYACCSLAACVLFLVARRHSGTTGWRRFFSCVIVLNLVHAAWWAFSQALRESGHVDLWEWHIAAYSLLPIASGIILVSVVFRERKLRAKLPWTHWVGVGLYLYGWLLDLLLMLLSQLVLLL